MKKHIVCFGDSNTHGYCAANDGRFDETERLTCLLQKNPWDLQKSTKLLQSWQAVIIWMQMRWSQCRQMILIICI